MVRPPTRRVKCFTCWGLCQWSRTNPAVCRSDSQTECGEKVAKFSSEFPQGWHGIPRVGLGTVGAQCSPLHHSLAWKAEQTNACQIVCCFRGGENHLGGSDKKEQVNILDLNPPLPWSPPCLSSLHGSPLMSPSHCSLLGYEMKQTPWTVVCWCFLSVTLD